jgi:hypothetical protein
VSAHEQRELNVARLMAEWQQQTEQNKDKDGLSSDQSASSKPSASTSSSASSAQPSTSTTSTSVNQPRNSAASASAAASAVPQAANGALAAQGHHAQAAAEEIKWQNHDGDEKVIWIKITDSRKLTSKQQRETRTRLHDTLSVGALKTTRIGQIESLLLEKWCK